LAPAGILPVKIRVRLGKMGFHRESLIARVRCVRNILTIPVLISIGTVL